MYRRVFSAVAPGGVYSGGFGCICSVFETIDCGIAGSPHQFIDKLEVGKLRPPLDCGVDARQYLM